jgi:hypothetical protein
MKFDAQMLRGLGRIADRIDLIRKHPHWYEADTEVLEELRQAADRVEKLLGRVKTVKAG